MRRILFLSLLVPMLPAVLDADETPKAPADKRLGPPKDYNGYFPWTPPTSKEAWAQRRQQVREQVLVANGLWPMPEKIPLKPVIHGKIECDGYTIEKVFFASLPGHYVCGNLYRPTASAGSSGKRPAVLCPHGHWANGRLHEAKDWESQMKQGAEKTKEGAMYPLQARCAQLARLGCVVFFYDMVGYADSQQIPHRQGFLDSEAELRLQNFMGLQSFNTIRALDFLMGLPEVDTSRVGVTGASGGGTQTFILGAIDDRPAAAFPAVMVSTAMQGGCICENCSYLRIGTGNIELAGIFAPKPLGMSGANDWTKEIETKGLPQLQALYKLLGADGNVMAKAHIEFGHNYNQVSREIMYNFFNKHLKLGHTEPVKEQPFVPVAPKELSVFDAEHPLPTDAVNAQGLRRYLTMEAEKQLQGLLPKDAKSGAEYRRVIGTALRVMMTDELPGKDALEVKTTWKRFSDYSFTGGHLSRKGQGEVVSFADLRSKGDLKDEIVVWVHPKGLVSLLEKRPVPNTDTGSKLNLMPEVKKIVDSGRIIIAVEPFRTGRTAKAKEYPINKSFSGYTFGYNRPLVAERVHDILTAIAYARTIAKKVHVVGFEEAGPWVVLARGLCGDAVTRTAADLNQFRFEQILSMNDAMMLPGALKYGGLLTLAGLCAPHEFYLHNTAGTGAVQFLEAAYRTAGKSTLHQVENKADAEAVVAWLLR